MKENNWIFALRVRSAAVLCVCHFFLKGFVFLSGVVIKFFHQCWMMMAAAQMKPYSRAKQLGRHLLRKQKQM
jgi:hypothetical protein